MKKIVFLILLVFASGALAQDMSGFFVKRFGDNLYLKYSLFGTTYCVSGSIDDATDLPRDWTPVSVVSAEKKRPFTLEQKLVCADKVKWVVAKNIYRGQPRATRPASIINGKGGRAEVGAPCGAFVADSTAGRQYRRAVSTTGKEAVTICEAVFETDEQGQR